jgi:hypothetical protein
MVWKTSEEDSRRPLEPVTTNFWIRVDMEKFVRNAWEFQEVGTSKSQGGYRKARARPSTAHKLSTSLKDHEIASHS